MFIDEHNLSSGFLFGYEDELACITDPLGGLVGGLGGEGEVEEDDEGWGDDWEEDWKRRRKREIPSYRWSSDLRKKSFNLLILSTQGRIRVLPLGDLAGLEQHGARDGQDKHRDEQLPEQGRNPWG